MRFIEVQSLSEITLLKVTVAVCNNFEDCVPNMPPNLATMHSKFNHWFFTVCGKCLDRMHELASTLQLPNELETKVEALCKHVYFQMCTWNGSLVKVHGRLVSDHAHIYPYLDRIDFRPYFEWKSIGTMDEKKTVQNLLLDEHLSVDFRFVMACYFCLESDVISLWEIMPEISKTKIRSHTCTSLPVISFWLKWLDKADFRDEAASVLRSFYGAHGAFDCILNNVTLLQYFLENFSYHLEKESLKDVVCHSSTLKEVTRFCLLEMDKEKQEIVFQKNPIEVLRSFLDWPWQRHFMKLAHSMFAYLQESDIFCLIFELRCKIAYQWRDYDYDGLLTKLLNDSPIHLKEYMRNKEEFLNECLERRLMHSEGDFYIDL